MKPADQSGILEKPDPDWTGPLRKTGPWTLRKTGPWTFEKNRTLDLWKKPDAGPLRKTGPWTFEKNRTLDPEKNRTLDLWWHSWGNKHTQIKNSALGAYISLREIKKSSLTRVFALSVWGESVTYIDLYSFYSPFIFNRLIVTRK